MARIVSALICLVLALGSAPVAAAQGAVTASYEPGPDRPVPFEFFAEKRIFLPMAIAGHPVQAMMDSGAAAIILDRAFADRIGLQADRSIPLRGAGGSVPAGLKRNVAVTVGSLRLSGVTVLITDFSDLARRMGHPVDAVLGREVFEAAIVELDFQARTATFHRPGGFAAPPSSLKLTLQNEEGGLKSLAARLEGGAPTEATFDLGNGGSVMISAAYAAAHPELMARPRSENQGLGVGGARTDDVITLSGVEVAGVRIPGPPAVITRNPSHPPTRGVNLGMDIWRRFHLYIDFKNLQLALQPYPISSVTPFHKDRSGLTVQPDGDALKVLFVAPGSPAQRAGWTTEDRIVSVNGAPITPAFVSGPQSQWNFARAGTRVELVTAGGQHRQLFLDDYF